MLKPAASLAASAALLALLARAPSARAAGRPLGCDKAPWNTYPMCDEALAADARVADMLARMPLKDKINAMYREFGSPFVNCEGNSGIPSLGLNGGIPNYSECLHGVAYGCTTVNGSDLCPTLFPNGQLLGASFNRSLFRNVGRVIGEELRALNNLGGNPSGFSCWSPDLNLARDPRWGRAQEVPGEDPYLTGEYGVAYVSGMMQGEDPRYVLTAASPKHYREPSPAPPAACLPPSPQPHRAAPADIDPTTLPRALAQLPTTWRAWGRTTRRASARRTRAPGSPAGRSR